MKVLMLGWEFPPYNAGGLGTACYGLTKSLASQGVQVTFVIPKAPYSYKYNFINLLNAEIDYDHILKLIKVQSGLIPYHDCFSKESLVFGKDRKSCFEIYGKNLIEEVEAFARRVLEICRNEEFDVIHAHDWMTYLAGIALKKATGKKLVLHIHATEFDRGVIGINPDVYNIEKQGFDNADLIIAVSNYTKSVVCGKYGICESRIRVAHNGVIIDNVPKEYNVKVFPKDKVVLFLGRITIQKGPEYFIEAAKLISDYMKDVKFIVTGSGDKLPWMIQRSAELGLSDKIVFTGFLKGDELKKMYTMADVYVMPSVSEPFGITPLESISLGTPVVISKQSGVSEVLNHCLKVDFWDTRKMANHIVAILQHKELKSTLKHHGFIEVTNINWDKAAEKVKRCYEEVVGCL
ncbi:MAG TPA: glycosyltransferase family 1 protein [Candidatus Woesearchaeota archaeon]|nr:glycosyltransferase family 1 protein [Candidatus Woesearchaeota archaeon]